MRPPFKILYLSPVSFIGGGEESLSALFRFLDRETFKAVAVLPDHGPFEERLLKDKIKVEIIPWGKALGLLSRRSLLSIFLFPLAMMEGIILLIRLNGLIRAEGIHLIHTNGLKCHFLGALLGKWSGVKTVWHIREIYTSPCIKSALNLFKLLGRVRVIAISRAVEKSLGLPGSSIIYNGVDTQLYGPFKSDDKLREEFGYSPGIKVITMLGALTPWKGQHVFIEALDHLKNRYPGLKALIVGEELYTGLGHKGYRCRLKEKVRTIGLENQVRFTGFRNDIPQLINLSLAIVHASIRPEPFGRILIEAMACGKPIIATQGGAVEEIVRPGIDGLIVEKGDSQSLARAIAALIEDEDMARRMGEQGRARVEKLFSAEKMARAIEEFYRMEIR